MPTIAALLVCVLACLQDDPARQACELVEKLRSDKVEEREAASQKLKELGQAAIPALTKAAGSPDAEVSKRAHYLIRLIDFTQKLPERIRKARPGIEDRLARGEEQAFTEVLLEVTRTAEAQPLAVKREDLDLWGPRALRGAASPDETRKVCEGLARHHLRAAIPQMIELLDAGDEHVRQDAAMALGSLSAQEARPRILALFEDKETDLELRYCAICALGRIEPKMYLRSCIDFLIALLKNDDETMRTQGYSFVSRHGGPKEAVPDILALLKEDEPRILYWVISTLTRMGEKESLPIILPFLEHKDASVRLASLGAFRHMAARSEWTKLMPRLKDPSAQIRASAIDILKGYEAKEAIPKLIDALRDDQAGVRYASVQALTTLSGKEVLGPLRPLLKDPHHGVRGEAAYVLCRLGLREGVPVLLAAAEEGEFSFMGDIRVGGFFAIVHEWRPLHSLNAIRQPTLWSRMRDTRLKHSLNAKREAIFKSVALEAGLELDWPRTPEPDTYGICKLAENTRLADAFEFLEYDKFDVILEPGRLRILPGDEALKFWTAWWKDEQEKK
jgi:HEAT repeat protein